MAEEKKLFIFPPPPYPGAMEWPGAPLAASNLVTATRGRTDLYDKDVDGQPGLLDKLLDTIQAHCRRHPEPPVHQHDVVIHGIPVRAHTNSLHLFDFWVDNWYSRQEWAQITGRGIEEAPRVLVYAFGGVEGEKTAAYYSRQASTIVFFNTSYYGQLKSWVLGAVGRILAEEHGIHSIHGACATQDSRGVLYIAPTGAGKSTASYGIMGLGGARFHSDDWVYVRYTYRTRDGLAVSPMRINSNGQVIEGYQVYRWLETNSWRKDDKVLARDLNDNELIITVGNLDLSRPPEAYAYTSEKVFYLRTNLVENFPETVFPVLTCKLENVPEVTEEFLKANVVTLNDLQQVIKPLPGFSSCFGGESEQAVKEKLARLFVFENARAMLDVAKVFPEKGIFTNPAEPAKLTNVILLKRDFQLDEVAEALTLPRFMTRLLIGETPAHTREIAYNAYRAVDDRKEAQYVKALEEKLGKTGRNPALYELYVEQPDIPETLYEEFELFRVMHQATACYDLNTVLQKDPAVKSKREAVNLTIQLITRLIEEQPSDLVLNVKDYSQFLS